MLAWMGGSAKRKKMGEVVSLALNARSSDEPPLKKHAPSKGLNNSKRAREIGPNSELSRGSMSRGSGGQGSEGSNSKIASSAHKSLDLLSIDLPPPSKAQKRSDAHPTSNQGVSSAIVMEQEHDQENKENEMPLPDMTEKKTKMKEANKMDGIRRDTPSVTCNAEERGSLDEMTRQERSMAVMGMQRPSTIAEEGDEELEYEMDLLKILNEF
jgi:hypothetical protein